MRVHLGIRLLHRIRDTWAVGGFRVIRVIRVLRVVTSVNVGLPLELHHKLRLPHDRHLHGLEGRGGSAHPLLEGSLVLQLLRVVCVQEKGRGWEAFPESSL